MEFKKMVIMTKQHKLQDNLESKKHEANLVWLTKVHAKNQSVIGEMEKFKTISKIKGKDLLTKKQEKDQVKKVAIEFVGSKEDAELMDIFKDPPKKKKEEVV